MSDINVALATRNNILVYMRKVMRPVAQGEILEHCDLPKGVDDRRLVATVDRSFRTLTASGEVVRMKAEHNAGPFAAKYMYRLAGPLDPTPRTIRTYKPRGTGRDAQRSERLSKMQAEANAIAAQIKAKQAEEAVARLDKQHEATREAALIHEATKRNAEGKFDTSVERLRIAPSGQMISGGQTNSLAGVNVEVTSSGLTITLGKITVTIKAD